MDLTPTLDADTKPTPPIHPTPKSLTFTSVTLKRHPTTTVGPPPPPPPSSMVVSYKECLKNHAATIGGHALDGCGEFMPSSSTNPTDPRSLKCAACGCHRNFHRREPQDPSHSPSPILNFSPVMMKSENPKKRYRTKFSKEQKEKMHSFSEKLGWRMQKGDDGLVQEFCNDIGVPRGVFKVWMHNNKNTLRKKPEGGNANANANENENEIANAPRDGSNASGGGGFDSDINNPYNPNSSNNDIHMNEEEDGCVNAHVSLNEMSS
uniref:ZF-HD homeobox protein At4g24660 family n=1 Tax=Cajanus cajan TaxID=3821 RepID=A0A151RTI4_CAJCA|nr:ZF-HD homeobox protein At4g24660 family [Cajanus cajan]